jgi:uracil-DNA glycosylase
VTNDFDTTVAAVRACEICKPHLPLGTRPVFQISQTARILVVGQAPGRRVHETGIPFNDPSGERLRSWMGIDRSAFYDSARIALLPMGFCYPGTGKSGDLPPRPECAEKWRKQLLALLPYIQLTLVIGQYAHDWHLGEQQKNSLTETVKNWKEYWPRVLALPHPSPRNNLWLRKNPWLEEDILPVLKGRVRQLLGVNFL